MFAHCSNVICHRILLQSRGHYRSILPYTNRLISIRLDSCASLATIPPTSPISFVRQLSITSPPSSSSSPNSHHDKEALPATKLTPSRWTRIKIELVHYYHGFRLFFVELKIASKLLWKLGRGRQLGRREQRHLITTINDVIRLVPFMVFIIVPFMELLLPVYLKFFPNALPSTFAHKSDNRKEAKMKKDYQVANILRDVLLDHASGRGKEAYMDFTSFMDRIRSPDKEQPSTEEVLKFAGLFENDLTLNSLNRINLICICELLDLPTIGPNIMLRGLIHSRIKRLERDDRLILRDGINTLTSAELQRACRDRGMAYFGLSDERLRFQLKQWTDFSLNRKVPISLLLLSRAFFYAPRVVPQFELPDQQDSAGVPVVDEHKAEAAQTTDFLKGVIRSLPIDVEQATAWKLAELAGERVPNKEKLMAVRKEDSAIADEQAEATIAETAVGAGGGDGDEKPSPSAGHQQQHHPEMTDESVIDQLARGILELAKKKNIDLQTIDIDDFIEKRAEPTDQTAPSQPKHARDVLIKKIDKILNNVNRLHSELKHKRSDIQENLLESERRTTDVDAPQDFELAKTISKKRQSLVDLDEILDVIERLKPTKKATTTNPTELREAVIERLADKDNKIDVGELFKVLQYMSNEHIELSKETLEEVSETIAGSNNDDEHPK